VGISGIDTRLLTRMLRDTGCINGVVCSDASKSDSELVAMAKVCTLLPGFALGFALLLRPCDLRPGSVVVPHSQLHRRSVLYPEENIPSGSAGESAPFPLFGHVRFVWSLYIPGNSMILEAFLHHNKRGCVWSTLQSQSEGLKDVVDPCRSLTSLARIYSAW
jgi:hypothetical protein